VVELPAASIHCWSKYDTFPGALPRFDEIVKKNIGRRQSLKFHWLIKRENVQKECKKLWKGVCLLLEDCLFVKSVSVNTSLFTLTGILYISHTLKDIALFQYIEITYCVKLFRW